MGQTKLTTMVDADALKTFTDKAKVIGLRRDHFLTDLLHSKLADWTKSDLRGSQENLTFWRTWSIAVAPSTTKLRISIDADLLDKLNRFCKERQIYRDGLMSTLVIEAAERTKFAEDVLFGNMAYGLMDWERIEQNLDMCAMSSENALAAGGQLLESLRKNVALRTEVATGSMEGAVDD